MAPERTGSGTGNDPSDPRWYRQVLGQYPTGVCVVTAAPPTGPPAGMAVGSFSSVSLDPPLVVFFPDKTSASWPRIESAGAFCVNVIAADQEHVCRRFASKAPDKFDGLSWRSASTGSPIVDGVVAWIDCTIESVQDAGDHFLVIGRVCELQLEQPSLPLLFFQGGYGRFSPLSMAAGAGGPIPTAALRLVDLVRPTIEALAAELSCQCIASALIDEELVIVASAGSVGARGVATLVGTRVPFLPPVGAPFAAHGSSAIRDAWLAAIDDEGERAAYALRLNAVGVRGYSLGLRGPARREYASTIQQAAAGSAAPQDLRRTIRQLNYDPLELSDDVLSAVRVISVPVFEAESVALMLSVYGFPKPRPSLPQLVGGLDKLIARTIEAAEAATQRVNDCVGH